MIEGNLNTVVYSRNVIEFVTVANEYVKIIETAGKENVRITLGKIQKMLPLLYLKVSIIPEFESSDEVILEKYVTEVEYNFLQQRVMNLLGEFDDYQEVFDQGMQFSEAPLTSSISENLTDIYQDIKDFIIAYSTGDEQVMQEALWECTDNFRNYWGQKLVNGLRAIHYLIYSSTDFQSIDEVVKD